MLMQKWSMSSCRKKQPKENRGWDLLWVDGQEDDDDQTIRQVVLVLVGLDDLDSAAGRHGLEAWAWSGCGHEDGENA